MANILLAYDNRADGAVLSGGTWVPALRLQNLQDRVQARVARTLDTDPASTWFDADLGALMYVRAIAIPNHNLSRLSRFRVRASQADPDFVTTVFDTDEMDVWPTIAPFGTVPWGAANWWGGKPTDRDLQGLNPTLTIVLPQSMLIRRLRFEFFDEGNTDGYVQLGRLFVADAWSPDFNASVGAEIGIEDPSTITQALSGTRYFEERNKLRWARVSFDMLTESEAMVAFDLMRLSGTTREVLYVHDYESTLSLIRWSWLGHVQRLNAIGFPRLGSHPNSAAFEVVELI